MMQINLSDKYLIFSIEKTIPFYLTKMEAVKFNYSMLISNFKDMICTIVN